MSRHSVTFDFHDTLVHSAPWFDLEVRTLVGSFLRWRAERDGDLISEAAIAGADRDYRRLRRAIILHGHELTAEQCVETILERIGEPAPSADIALGVEELMRRVASSAAPVAGAVKTVRELADAGVAVAVVSSAVHHPFLEWSLDGLALRPPLEVVTTSASCGFYKSRPEIFWATLDALRSTPERSVHVGDSLRFDVGGARRAGMKTVWLRPAGERAAIDASAHEPDLVLDSLIDSSSAILRLLQTTN